MMYRTNRIMKKVIVNTKNWLNPNSLKFTVLWGLITLIALIFSKLMYGSYYISIKPRNIVGIVVTFSTSFTIAGFMKYISTISEFDELNKILIESIENKDYKRLKQTLENLKQLYKSTLLDVDSRFFEFLQLTVRSCEEAKNLFSDSLPSGFQSELKNTKRINIRKVLSKNSYTKNDSITKHISEVQEINSKAERFYKSQNKNDFNSNFQYIETAKGHYQFISEEMEQAFENLSKIDKKMNSLKDELYRFDSVEAKTKAEFLNSINNYVLNRRNINQKSIEQIKLWNIECFLDARLLTFCGNVINDDYTNFSLNVSSDSNYQRILKHLDKNIKNKYPKSVKNGFSLIEPLMQEIQKIYKLKSLANLPHLLHDRWLNQRRAIFPTFVIETSLLSLNTFKLNPDKFTENIKQLSKLGYAMNRLKFSYSLNLATKLIDQELYLSNESLFRKCVGCLEKLERDNSNFKHYAEYIVAMKNYRLTKFQILDNSISDGIISQRLEEIRQQMSSILLKIQPAVMNHNGIIDTIMKNLQIISAELDLYTDDSNNIFQATHDFLRKKIEKETNLIDYQKALRTDSFLMYILPPELEFHPFFTNPFEAKLI